MDGMGGGVNFRQVGKRTQGRLLLGQSQGRTQMPTTTSASIPSKFETILYTGATEADGFGKRTTRFQPQLVDLPGPGAYHKSSNPESKSDSFSKKGYGNGFVSKTNRWYMPDQGGVPLHFPGPGSYENTDFLTEKKLRQFSEAAISGTFRDKENESLVENNDEIPGPGTYNHMEKRRRRRGRQMRYPKDHSMRKSYSAPGMRPTKGYGEYEDRSNITNQPDPEVNGSFGTRDTRFKNEVRDEDDITPGSDAYHPNKEYVMANKYLDKNVPSMAFKSGSHRSGIVNDDPAEGPGPGHYRMHESDDLRKAEVDEDGWRQFKVGQLDKFGQPYNRRVPVDNFPGPGHYNPQKPVFKDAGQKKDDYFQGGGYSGGGNGSVGGSLRGYPGPTGYSTATKKRAIEYGRYLHKSSASISASIQRDIVNTSSIKAPGPAYYNPDKIAVTEKRSYHLNQSRRFMS